MVVALEKYPELNNFCTLEMPDGTGQEEYGDDIDGETDVRDDHVGGTRAPDTQVTYKDADSRKRTSGDALRRTSAKLNAKERLEGHTETK